MITAKNIMTKDVLMIPRDASISAAASLIASKLVSSLVVIEKNKPIAIISENDIVRGIVSKKTKVSDVMDREFKIVSPVMKFSELSKSLREEKIRRFPVVENDRLVGIITETDILEATRDFTRYHNIIQDVILAIFGFATAFFLFYFSPFGASFLR